MARYVLNSSILSTINRCHFGHACFRCAMYRNAALVSVSGAHVAEVSSLTRRSVCAEGGEFHWGRSLSQLPPLTKIPRCSNFRSVAAATTTHLKVASHPTQLSAPTIRSINARSCPLLPLRGVYALRVTAVALFSFLPPSLFHSHSRRR